MSKKNTQRHPANSEKNELSIAKDIWRCICERSFAALRGSCSCPVFVTLCVNDRNMQMRDTFYIFDY